MTSKPPYEKAIGAFNADELAGQIDDVAGKISLANQMLPTVVDVYARFGWRMPNDSLFRPNAWPRFSIWPFRLRRGGRQ